ncbi:MAG: autotransporter outer membrane beta-barrel domain-containing protein [Anaerovibrio sp.]|nr:autotransporter outer membrane beta-barrel domain-containing protein [Anaerovibrio sp.]
MSMKKSKKGLTGLILAALMCTGGYYISPVNAADVTVNEVETAEYVYNGQTKDDAAWSTTPTGEQSRHSATIKGTVNKDLYGGYSSDSNASNNTITIDGGTVGDPSNWCSISGGDATTAGIASDNNVIITGGTINSDVWGGHGNTLASGNTVTISGSPTFADGKGVHGGAANNDATDNTVNILSAVTLSYLMGGESYNGGTVSGNTLNIAATGVKLTNEYTGLSAFQNLNFYLPTTITTSDTMLTVNGTADVTNAKIGVLAQGTLANLVKNNKVTLLSATILNGGDSISQTTDISVPTSITTVSTYEFSVATESNNIVATLTSDGSSDSGSGSSGSGSSESGSGSSGSGSSGSGSSESGSGSSGSGSSESGSGSSGSGSSDSGSGSSDSGSGSSGSGSSDSGSGSSDSGSGSSGSGSSDSGSGSSDSGSGSSSDSGSSSSDSGSGSSDSGSSSSDSGSSSIIDSDTAKANAKSVVETRAATTTFINAGSDMLASQGFAQAANAVALDTAQQQQSNGGAPVISSFTPYAALGGSSMRAESGSHVDTKGFGLNVGFAREIANSQGKLLFGPLVEYGGGKYDSYLDNGTHGDGGSHYWGIGLMARQINHDGFYYEGSIRGGRVNSDYNGGFNNQTVKYDSSSTYIAAHVGLGKVKNIGHNNTLDGYMKYFFSHQGGDNVTMHASVSGDESWSFDSVNSHRLRLGARLTHRINDRNSFYGGLAYQYEFGGEATAHYNGGSTPSPSVKGGSGMLELGWQVKPGGPVSIDFGVTGWIGKQRGGSVQLGATWSF